MGNREKILTVLHNAGPLCDGCLQERAHIKNHATVNQITRSLVNIVYLNKFTCFKIG